MVVLSWDVSGRINKLAETAASAHLAGLGTTSFRGL